MESLVRTCQLALGQAGVHFGHGTDNALDEAAWLVLHVIGQPLDGSYDDWDALVDNQQAETIRELLAMRIEDRQPLAYLLGEAWFCGLRFEVTPDVLVPRSPLAELIQHRFEPWVAPGSLDSALDLCTGSGCIAIAMAKTMPGLRVVASDISEAALEVARRNVGLQQVGSQVQVLQSDLFAALQGQRFDLVVSNPPYVPAGAIDQLPEEYRAEPGLGLVSGDSGLDLPLRILLDCANYLEDDGVLICEVGESAERLQDLLPSVPLTWLEFEHGGEGVFTMSRSELLAAREMVRKVMENGQHVL